MSPFTPFRNLSPSPDRTGRACAWIEDQGRVLMVAVRNGRWTLPGGGIMPGETSVAAAIREAWEEAGVHAEWTGEPSITLRGSSGTLSECWKLRLTHAEDSSPEGREVRWVEPFGLPWCQDIQIRQVLSVSVLEPSLGLSQRP